MGGREVLGGRCRWEVLSGEEGGGGVRWEWGGPLGGRKGGLGWEVEGGTSRWEVFGGRS